MYFWSFERSGPVKLETFRKPGGARARKSGLARSQLGGLDSKSEPGQPSFCQIVDFAKFLQKHK